MWKLHQERKFVDDIAYDLIRTQFTLALGAGSLVGRVSIRFRGAGEVTCDRFRQGLQRMEAVAGGAEGRAQQVHTRDRAAGDGAERASLCAVQADAGGGRGGGGKHEVPVWGGVRPFRGESHVAAGPTPQMCRLRPLAPLGGHTVACQ